MYAKWVEMNKLLLNIDKIKCFVFGSRISVAKSTPLSFAGGSVDQVTKTRLLGVKLDNLLFWSDQIDHIVFMLGKGIAVLRKCSAHVPSSVMTDVVRSLVLSHLEYCPVIWSKAAEKHLKNLRLAQNMTARLVFRCSFCANMCDI